jgi:hypothetical protein
MGRVEETEATLIRDKDGYIRRIYQPIKTNIMFDILRLCAVISIGLLSATLLLILCKYHAVGPYFNP